jgi:hypothetical protein
MGLSTGGGGGGQDVYGNRKGARRGALDRIVFRAMGGSGAIERCQERWRGLEGNRRKRIRRVKKKSFRVLFSFSTRKNKK